jgi:hypothetical protein
MRSIYVYTQKYSHQMTVMNKSLKYSRIVTKALVGSSQFLRIWFLETERSPNGSFFIPVSII